MNVHLTTPEFLPKNILIAITGVHLDGIRDFALYFPFALPRLCALYLLFVIPSLVDHVPATFFFFLRVHAVYVWGDTSTPSEVFICFELN